MARKYEVNTAVKFFNRLMKSFLRLGFGPRDSYILTVRGRKTGKEYSTPVTLIQEGGKRWLVSPYGEVNWVRNARASGHVMFTRGKQSETVSIIELPPQESAPILKKYLAKEPITRPYFDVQPDSPLEAFVGEAQRHPVFEISEHRPRR